MSGNTRIEREQWVAELCAHIADRAETGGWMVAVRRGEDAVTFGDLTAAINDYRRVVGVQGMSLSSALTAALLHTAPGLVELDDLARAGALDEMIRWLGRDIVVTPVADTGPRLSSVG